MYNTYLLSTNAASHNHAVNYYVNVGVWLVAPFVVGCIDAIPVARCRCALCVVCPTIIAAPMTMMHPTPMFHFPYFASLSLALKRSYRNS